MGRLKRAAGRLLRFGDQDPFRHVRSATLQLRDIGELKRAFGWTADPILDDPSALEYQYLEDVNDRRLLDAQAIATVARNSGATTIVDIGTSYGHSAALLAMNAPQAVVHTVNIPPEQFEEGGELTTIKLSRDDIGRYYRERALGNVRQIFANTAHWQADVGPIDVAFIDGSHDTDFVINDTLKVLEHLRPGGFLLWHDFNPTLVENYHWIGQVCRGVDQLLRRGQLRGRILQVRDSWVGVHQVH